jgi:hypothetical protein
LLLCLLELIFLLQQEPLVPHASEQPLLPQGQASAGNAALTEEKNIASATVKDTIFVI